jgi:chromosome segregation ATPase
MSDENDTKALNNVAEGENSETSTPEVKPQATEESVETSEATNESDLTKQSGKGANNRIRELNARTKQAEERARSLEGKMKELTQKAKYSEIQYPSFNNQANEPLVSPGEELTVEQLDQRLQQRDQRLAQQIEARVNLRINQDRYLQNIEKEAIEVMSIYPQLNPDDKKSFDKDLSDSIVAATEAYVQSNPTGSVKQFVSKMMKPYTKSITKQVADKTSEITKQVIESAARPNQVAKTEKPFSELSIKEMEERLGVVY